jgi:hypothetical protein
MRGLIVVAVAAVSVASVSPTFADGGPIHNRQTAAMVASGDTQMGGAGKSQAQRGGSVEKGAPHCSPGAYCGSVGGGRSTPWRRSFSG